MGQPVGVRLEEWMHGFVSTDVALDFEEAARAGERAGTSFSADVAVVSDDLDRMIEDPSHAARLEGTVNVPTLASTPFTLEDGVFNLMAALDPSRPDVRETRYGGRLTAADGLSLVFDGFKVSRDDPGFDSWSDTTTVFVSVRRDSGGPLLVKGIATMTPQDVLRSVRSIEVTNARSAKERLDATARFGRFCLGPVFELYWRGKV